MGKTDEKLKKSTVKFTEQLFLTKLIVFCCNSIKNNRRNLNFYQTIKMVVIRRYKMFEHFYFFKLLRDI